MKTRPILSSMLEFLYLIMGSLQIKISNHDKTLMNLLNCILQETHHLFPSREFQRLLSLIIMHMITCLTALHSQYFLVLLDMQQLIRIQIKQPCLDTIHYLSGIVQPPIHPQSRVLMHHLVITLENALHL
jgi:hypothetical protein